MQTSVTLFMEAQIERDAPSKKKEGMLIIVKKLHDKMVCTKFDITINY